MNEQEKKAFLKKMGYSGSLMRNVNLSEEKPKKKDVQIEDVGAARRLYNIFNARSYQEPAVIAETFEQFAQREDKV